MKYTFLTVVLLILLISCNHFDNTDLDTQFIYFNSAKIKPGNITGLNKGDISDLKVSVDGVNLDILRVPRKMAFNIENESAGLIFLGAVPMDGKKSNSTIYPPLDFVEMVVDKDPHSIDTVDVLLDYRDDVVFNTIEGFETDNKLSKDIDENPETYLVRTDEDAFEGKYSGKMTLSIDEPEIHIGTSQKLDIEDIYQGLFLELTYKNEIDLFVGLSATSFSGDIVNNYKLFLSPKEEWNTIYVDLTNELLTAGSSAKELRLVLGAELDTSIDSTADIYIDNVKFLYY